MDSREPSPAGEYREALRLGEELLRILQEPMSDSLLDRLEALTAQREAVSNRAQALIDRSEGSDEGRLALERLVDQQHRIEAECQKLMAAILQTAREAQSTGAKLQGVRHLLNPGTPAQVINKRR